jgi:hypothetical protein
VAAVLATDVAILTLLSRFPIPPLLALNISTVIVAFSVTVGGIIMHKWPSKKEIVSTLESERNKMQTKCVGFDSPKD